MNILVFSWRDPKHPLAGGAEQVMHEHMKGWVEAGHSVTLFSSKIPNLSKQEVLDGIIIKRGGYQYGGVQLAGFWYYLNNKKNYDLVVDQFHGVPFFTPLYVDKSKLAVIQETAREVWFLNPLPKPLNWLVGLIGYLGEKHLFLIYKKVMFMTGSQSAKKDIAKFGISSDHISVVPHGVVVVKPKLLPRKEKKVTLAFLGVLSKDKGIEDVLKCFTILDQRNYHLWVIGRPETRKYGQRVASLVKELKLDGKIKFWGYVSQQKKFELLGRVHLLVNPSVREGWGLVNIEANAMGIPVVSYTSPGLVDSVKDGISGVLVRKNTPEELAASIIKLSNDDNLYQALSVSAKRWSDNFSWDRSRKQSLELIEQIIR